ncbi:MAG: hypothetical protein WKF85_10580 [Chitinophagaceae bacterium]
MKKIISILPVCAISILIFSFDKGVNNNQTINPFLGDISFVSKFGHPPNKNTDENLRIKTHLEYVETRLRKKDISHLTEQLKEKRLQLLNLLRKYSQAGVFPRNYDYEECRKPCFIDKDKRICAVGYLIEKTTGRQTAENINNKHKSDELSAMNDKTVQNWIKHSGLTKEECAMIQPMYGPAPVYTYNHISARYGISSSTLGGINLSLNAINAIQIAKGKGGKAISKIGLITGAGQVVLGITNFSKNAPPTWNRNTRNESQRILSMLNISIGTSTMLLSGWNLIAKKKAKDKITTWNIYSYPDRNKMIVGLNLTRKL